MKRLLSTRTIPVGALALALPSLLTACSSQAQDSTQASAVTTPDTAAAAHTTAPDAAAVADATAPDAANLVASPTAVVHEAAASAAAAARGYRLDRQVPQGLSEAQMKSIWVPIPPAKFAVGAHPRVRLVTSKGTIVLALDPKAAPLHTRSFVYLAKRGYFNNTTFHRWADLTNQGGTIIQGGDPLSRSEKTRELAGQGGPGYTIPRERNSLKHEALVIAAARTSDPDSAGSQFYITQAPVYFLDKGDGYTVFGRVIQGADVAKKLRQDDKIIRAQVLK